MTGNINCISKEEQTCKSDIQETNKIQIKSLREQCLVCIWRKIFVKVNRQRWNGEKNVSLSKITPCFTLHQLVMLIQWVEFLHVWIISKRYMNVYFFSFFLPILFLHKHLYNIPVISSVCSGYWPFAPVRIKQEQVLHIRKAKWRW